MVFYLNRLGKKALSKWLYIVSCESNLSEYVDAEVRSLISIALMNTGAVTVNI